MLDHPYEPPPVVGEMPPEVAEVVFAGVGAPPCARCGRPWRDHQKEER